MNYTYEYLPRRGITAETHKRYGVLTKIDAEGKPVSVGYKYPNEDMKVRSLADKDFYWIKGSSKTAAGLFGTNLFTPGEHKYVTITEGEDDALSLYQVLNAPVVSVQSAGSAARDVAVSRSWLNGYERIYLAFDGDAAGRDALREVAKLFDYNKVYVLRFSRQDRKDSNDYVRAGEADELKRLWWSSKKYLPETIISSLEEFKNILSEKPKWGVPYPWPTLTEMTYGIRTGESVLLTAQEGVGKTELMHAIEHKLLTETDDNVGAIFLEEPKRRHLQALAGVELRKPVHLPDVAVEQDQIFSAIQKVVKTDDRLHLYSHFGSDDPVVFLDTIRFLATARSCRYILLDHITMVCSGLAGEDERRTLDYFSTRLEMMVKELDFALILVSHVNDMGQTRGSRYISKIADTRIDATRDLLTDDPVQKNITQLSISKNRFGMKTGSAGLLQFDPKTYSYQELAANVNDQFDGHIDRQAA